MASDALRESSREYAGPEHTEPARVGARVCAREAHGEEQRLDCDGEMSPSTSMEEIELALLTAVEENEARGETDAIGVPSVDAPIARDAGLEGGQARGEADVSIRERGRVFGQLAANLARNGLVGFQERRGEILLRRSYPEGYSFVVAIVPEQ